MHDYTPEAAAVIESAEREFVERFRVDWNNDGRFDHPLSDLSGYIVSTARDQVLTQTTPAEIMLIEGYAAGSLKVELVGDYDGVSLAAHFAPFNGRSIFYREGLALGVTVTYELGVDTRDRGVEWYPQFVGVVRDVATDRESGTVTIECLDNVERMRTAVDIPPYALWQSYLQNGFKRGGLVDSSSVIDLAARSGGFTMGPAQRWAYYKGQPRTDRFGPILSVPFHGSALPEIGMLDNDESWHLTEEWERDPDPAVSGRAEAYRDGPHGYLALNAVPRGRNTWNYKKFWIDEWNAQAGTLVGTWVLGCWVYWTGNNVDENSVVLDVQIRTNHLQLYVRGNDGGVEARIIETNGFIAWTNTPLRMTTPGWHYIEANIIVENRQNYAARVRIDDEYSAENRWSGRDARDVNDRLSGLVRVEHKFAVSDVYVTKANFLTTFANFSYDTTPADTARVSWGRNRFAFTLRESGREAWELAKEISAAEYGVVFFDEFGRFVFWNYRDMTSRQETPVRTFTLDDLSSLALRNTVDSVRNVWTVTTQTARAYPDIAYDLGRDGVPFVRDGRSGQLVPATFILPAHTAMGGLVFWINVDDHTIALNPNDIWDRANAIGEFGAWENEFPTFGLKSYTGTKYQPLPPHSEQKMTTRHIARLAMSNGLPDPVGFLLVRDPARPQDGSPRFRLEGTIVHEDPPYTWSLRDESSIADYGERVIELAGNRWLQDEYQTRAMLADIVARMGRPIPVSDTLTVPGDPRIQLGDTIDVRDVDGFGERMRMQVYGIRREYTADGLTDTYTVEMISAAGKGIWDSPTYGLWDQSLIWS